MRRACELSRRANAGRAALLGLALFGGSGAAPAQDAASPWRVYVGAAQVHFVPDAVVTAGGQVVPGGQAAASGNRALAFGVVYAFTPELSAELALGLPPTTTLSGAGTLASAGTLGRVTYGPAVLSLRHALPALGPLQPYVGLGVNYTLVLRSEDAFVQQLDVRSAWGGVAQLGATLPLGGPWSLSLDAKKVWAKTVATGTLPALGGVATRSEVRLDPLISTLSLSYRY